MKNGPLYSWAFHFRASVICMIEDKNSNCYNTFKKNGRNWSVICLKITTLLLLLLKVLIEWLKYGNKQMTSERGGNLTFRINNSYQFNIFLLGRGERWGKWTGLQLRCEIRASRRHSPENSQRYSPLIFLRQLQENCHWRALTPSDHLNEKNSWWRTLFLVFEK